MQPTASELSRRSFLAAGTAVGLAATASSALTAGSALAAGSPVVAGELAATAPPPAGGSGVGTPPTAAPSGLYELFPTQPPALVREMVGVSHGNLARVEALLNRQPALARAAWDWGYGDWESALGAASHVGNHEIAELLLANGARPNLFSAAMLGQLEVVRALVAALPGAQRTHGPHGITLLAHARVGGERALEVRRYLEALGDADLSPALQPLAEEQLAALLGRYRFGPGPQDVLIVERPKEQLVVRRGDLVPRNLSHLGELAFFPSGAEAVRLRFSAEAPARQLSLFDPDLVVTAVREAA